MFIITTEDVTKMEFKKRGEKFINCATLQTQA